MKIQSFELYFSSLRTYTETVSQRKTGEFAFVDLMDLKLDERADSSPAASQSSPDLAGQWYQPLTVNGRSAVSMSEAFMSELDNLRRLMDAAMEAFLNTAGQNSGFRLEKVNQVYGFPVSRTGYQAWEYQETRTVTHTEFEQTQVAAQGKIMTADNQEIDFSLDLTMARTHIRQESVSVTQSGFALVDPLVIRTDARAPQLFGGEFSFDLDMDGNPEDMAFPGAGTAFLAFDKNGDGQINDGSELFGPATGDGFGELAAYDQDQNDWIDENDGIFDQLTLWERADEGGMRLTRLRDAGIGAIYLAGVDSPFSVTDPEKGLVGQVAKTSVALTETGDALPVQEVFWNV